MLQASHPIVRTVVLHPEPIFALGLAAALGREPDIQVTSSESDADLVLADYGGGVQRATSELPVVVVTTIDREHDIRVALQSGVRGYLMAGCAPAELAEAVRVVSRGSKYLCRQAAQRVAESLTRDELTARESEVLALLSAGSSNKAIARELDLAVSTVKVHVKAILCKLDAASRTQASAIATQRGLVADSARTGAF